MFEVDLETLYASLCGSTPVSFTFMKKDGTLRNAVGTLHETLIPEECKPKDPSINYANGDNLKYFDLEKGAWRSLSKNCAMIQIIE